MTNDIEIREQQRLWEVMRAVEPPPAARVRVLERVEAPTRVSRFRWSLTGALVVASFLLGLWVRSPDSDPVAAHHEQQVLVAEGVTQDGRVVRVGDTLGSGLVSVADRGHLQMVLERGAVEIDGDARVEGPRCAAHVKGNSQVSVVEDRMEVRVFAGSAFVEPPIEECHVVFLSPSSPTVQQASPMEQEAKPIAEAAVQNEGIVTPQVENVDQVIEDDVEEAEAKRTRRKTSTDVDLNRQTETYWRVQKLRESDASSALRELHAFKKKWPRSPLRQEIDLAMIDTLIQLGDVQEGKRAARRFLKRYPDSPRANELRDLTGEAR